MRADRRLSPKRSYSFGDELEAPPLTWEVERGEREGRRLKLKGSGEGWCASEVNERRKGGRRRSGKEEG